MRRVKPSFSLLCPLVVIGVPLGAGVAFIYSGLYPMAADRPHGALSYWALETLRERSIARAARDVVVPADLDSAARLLRGGADYNDMCAGCHLKPGKSSSDLSVGLYPSPPNLARGQGSDGRPEVSHDGQYAQQRQFWIIKHGIKASGMPAWGPGHDDERIWSMVAFLQRLPELSAVQYQIITARGATASE